MVVLSSRQSTRAVPLDRHPEYTIHKDIDIDQQLERALTAVLGEETVPSSKYTLPQRQGCVRRHVGRRELARQQAWIRGGGDHGSIVGG